MSNSTLLIAQVSEFSANNVFFNAQGVTGAATAGQTSSIDLQMTDDNFLTGGQLNVKFGAWGDSVNMQVVLPNGVVYRQFATNIQIMDGSQKQEAFNLTYPAKILAGLILRISYTSTGTVSPLVSANYDLHKALY